MQAFSYSPAAGIKIVLTDLVLLGLAILFIWLSITSLGALINAVKLIYNKKTTSLKENFEVGHKNFWPILGLNVLGKLIIFGLLALISLPVLFKSSSLPTALLYILLFVIAVLIVITVSLLIIYASIFVIAKKKSFGQSIQHAWHLFINNWLVSLEMALVLFLANIVAGFGLMFLLLFLAVPFVLLLVIFYYLALNVLFWFCLILFFITIIIVIALVSGLLTSFKISAWTLTFIELNKKSFAGKLFEWLERLFARFSKRQN